MGVFFLVFIELVEEVIHPLTKGVLLFFRKLVKAQLELVADVSAVHRLVTDDELDDFSDIGKLVIAKIIKRGEKARVEKESFEISRCDLFLKSVTVLVNVVDDTCFFLQVFVVIGPLKDVFDFRLGV